MIQALSTNGTDEPFDTWGLPGRARNSEDFGDQHVCGLPPEGIAFRWRTVGWCRRAKISNWSEARVRSVDVNPASSDIST